MVYRDYLRRMNEAFRVIHIEREADFWKLCWQSVDIYRFLTPVGLCRNLRCVVDRMKTLDVSLAELADPHARQDLARNAAWFEVCVAIAANFNWARFQGSGSAGEAIRLRFVNHVERGECPGATWYIADGVHRTLVAAVLLDQGVIQWRPVNAITLEET